VSISDHTGAHHGEPDRTSGTLPNLLLAGVPKAGTTSLFRYLEQHPDICSSSDKEIGYFNPLRHGGTLGPLDTFREHS
jgi:hypothetical protein